MKAKQSFLLMKLMLVLLTVTFCPSSRAWSSQVGVGLEQDVLVTVGASLCWDVIALESCLMLPKACHDINKAKLSKVGTFPSCKDGVIMSLLFEDL